MLIPDTSSRRPASQAMLQRYFELGLFLKFMHAVLRGCALYVCIRGEDLLSLRWVLNLAHRLCMWFDWMRTVEDDWMNLDVYVMH